MNRFTSAFFLTGRIVIEIDQRGCMAEQDYLKRVMMIEDVQCQSKLIPGSEKIKMAVCRVLYSSDGTAHTRLVEPEYINVLVEDGGFQPETFNGDVMQHFVWRH